ncbi:unnamed protein product [Oppiella nova]|uniref:LRAT domain-containing protein n=1 Tax=Oppiella nova TaxID=334625 RepID=A0A7R9LQJ5_9ACAR|nr:unnamed protein product [Oppiella nova]CAG2165967.1 unnamed protein product [Oppiella nova]
MGDCHIAHLTTIGKNTLLSSQSHGIIEMTDLACGGQYRMCRVNNLTEYAKKKNYPAKSREEIMANIYTGLSAFKNNPNYKYHLLFNNCGHMVTFWKYGVAFNPEVHLIS